MQCPIQGPDKELADKAFGRPMAMQMANPELTVNDLDYSMPPRPTISRGQQLAQQTGR